MTFKKPSFIVIEGLDGSGKSTISELLVQSIDNSILYKTPPHEYKTIREYVDNSGNKYSELYYYLSGVFYASTQIQKFLKEGKTVVCDRYYYTTFTAYSYLLESTFIDFWKNINLIISKLEQPDYSFILTVQNKEIREERLNRRAKLSRDDKESLDDAIINRTLIAYQKFDDLIEIDTSYLTPEQVVDVIKNYISKAT
ncbi:hypothetical protein PN492_04075 [Dolichospermum circinale CS-537/01]|uniref:Thymidylate kinase n=1 Tax=Dolichospermum circinale CS-537/01 TaxID=3021739 RepID=A0ABT5A2G0_9CYAN|nr:hypothetical protein [Dolichospermum circinale]MDB9485730.1 hypothetical protein [Dolichospermum circinale CS-537/01]